jgi:TonB family protein
MMKEISMSKRRLFSSLAAICGALVLTARFAVVIFPITAPAQEIVKGDANLLHRAPIEYPSEAIEQGIQGTVVVSAILNERGVVIDARVVSGPDPLRKAALKSVLDWHYAAQTPSPVEVAVDFKLPTKTGASALPPISGTLKQIQFTGVSASVREAVLNKLPVHEGDSIQADVDPRGEFIGSLREAIHEVDEHLGFNLHLSRSASTELTLIVFYRTPTQASDRPTPIADAQGKVTRLRVGGNVQATQVISAPKPLYPPQAKLASIEGKVRLNVIVNKDGTVQSVEVASGDPALSGVAVEAVRQWVYRPTLLNGQPVEVVTVVDVNFTLRQ